MTNEKQKPREFYIQEELVTQGSFVKTIRTVHLLEDAQLAADQYNHGDVVTHVIEYSAYLELQKENEFLQEKIKCIGQIICQKEEEVKDLKFKFDNQCQLAFRLDSNKKC